MKDWKIKRLKDWKIERLKDKDDDIVLISMKSLIPCAMILLVIVEYDKRRQGLPSALVVMQHGSNITKESTAI